MEQSSIDLINENIAINKVLNTTASYLKWGDPNNLLDGHKYDVIVGSDIIYSQVVLGPLAKTISHFLAEGGVAYIANNRVRYDFQRVLFEQELDNAGLTISERIDLNEDGGTQVMRLLVIMK